MSARREVLRADAVSKTYRVSAGLFGRRRAVQAVRNVTIALGESEILGLIGESGCGKSTLSRLLLGLEHPSSGEVFLDGAPISRLSRKGIARVLQPVFQDPYSSLNPRMSVGNIVGQAFAIHNIAAGKEREERVAALLERVGLRAKHMRSYPHQFSGGQRQRIGIARALALNTKLIVGDEPVSALDVSIQAQVINLLMDLQEERGLSYLFISHDLAVVEHISHRVAVMYLGKLVELADKREIYLRPQHPYTEALLSAVPVPDPAGRGKKRILLEGDVPSPVNPPKGCRFHTRCPYAVARCRTEEPEWREVDTGHWVACHLR